jgi:hypothetical protein
MNNLALVVNTVSKNSDIWEMFFYQLKKHTPTNFYSNKYVFLDQPNSVIPKDFCVVKYDEKKLYREQFLQGISKVKEDFCIYISEDYILYDNINSKLLNSYKKQMECDTNICFIRLHKGGVTETPFNRYNNFEDLFIVDKNIPYFYSQTATLWRTRDLEAIHQNSPNFHIGNTDWQNSFEWNANSACLNLNKIGLFVYKGEQKRGIYHYDSFVFPHIATAFVKGKWNLKEYSHELSPLLKQFGIDINKRGEV